MLIPPRATDIPVRVINTSTRTATLSAGKVLTNLTRVTVCDRISAAKPTGGEQLTDAQRLAIEDMIGRVDPSVDADIKEQLRQLLIKYRATFSYADDDYGHTTLITHRMVIMRRYVKKYVDNRHCIRQRLKSRYRYGWNRA